MYQKQHLLKPMQLQTWKKKTKNSYCFFYVVKIIKYQKVIQVENLLVAEADHALKETQQTLG